MEFWKFYIKVEMKKSCFSLRQWHIPNIKELLFFHCKIYQIISKLFKIQIAKFNIIENSGFFYQNFSISFKISFRFQPLNPMIADWTIRRKKNSQ